ncbi:conserved hypothetical protein [Ricinus communis]|uniref:Uncharacterized protein n=1 Tax=Ricinus communis TaxID=3988 RepID=B9S854_RICCO|nr:conserved hypothetical protein [Ricinus communis]
MVDKSLEVDLTLMDAGYNNGEGFLVPCQGTLVSREASQPSTIEYYNIKHYKARNVIER